MDEQQDLLITWLSQLYTKNKSNCNRSIQQDKTRKVYSSGYNQWTHRSVQESWQPKQGRGNLQDKAPEAKFTEGQVPTKQKFLGKAWLLKPQQFNKPHMTLVTTIT
jgi:hypothetical protein